MEEFIPEIESSEWGGNSAEVSKEASEKASEKAKKASAQIAKTQKDEKKAKKYDFLLAGFLVKIIVDKKYDFILESLFASIHSWYPSNFILWILSLINNDISNEIRRVSNKEQVNFVYEVSSESVEFDDNNMNSEIKNRINFWVEDIIDSVTLEYSNIQTQKLKRLLNEDETILLAYASKIFTFFLKGINITISESKSLSITGFILSEIKKTINSLDLEEF